MHLCMLRACVCVCCVSACMRTYVCVPVCICVYVRAYVCIACVRVCGYVLLVHVNVCGCKHTYMFKHMHMPTKQTTRPFDLAVCCISVCLPTHLGQGANAVRRQKLVLVQDVAEDADQLLLGDQGQQQNLLAGPALTHEGNLERKGQSCLSGQLGTNEFIAV